MFKLTTKGDLGTKIKHTPESALSLADLIVNNDQAFEHAVTDIPSIIAALSKDAVLTKQTLKEKLAVYILTKVLIDPETFKKFFHGLSILTSTIHVLPELNEPITNFITNHEEVLEHPIIHVDDVETIMNTLPDKDVEYITTHIDELETIIDKTYNNANTSLGQKFQKKFTAYVQLQALNNQHNFKTFFHSLSILTITMGIFPGLADFIVNNDEAFEHAATYINDINDVKQIVYVWPKDAVEESKKKFKENLRVHIQSRGLIDTNSFKKFFHGNSGTSTFCNWNITFAVQALPELAESLIDFIIKNNEAFECLVNITHPLDSIIKTLSENQKLLGEKLKEKLATYIQSIVLIDKNSFKKFFLSDVEEFHFGLLKLTGAMKRFPELAQPLIDFIINNDGTFFECLVDDVSDMRAIINALPDGAELLKIKLIQCIPSKIFINANSLRKFFRIREHGPSILFCLMIDYPDIIQPLLEPLIDFIVNNDEIFENTVRSTLFFNAVCFRLPQTLQEKLFHKFFFDSQCFGQLMASQKEIELMPTMSDYCSKIFGTTKLEEVKAKIEAIKKLGDNAQTIVTKSTHFQSDISSSTRCSSPPPTNQG